jgi:hypothetical protein
MPAGRMEDRWVAQMFSREAKPSAVSQDAGASRKPKAKTGLNHRDTEVTEKEPIRRMVAPGIFFSSSVFSVSLWFTNERGPGLLENLKI